MKQVTIRVTAKDNFLRDTTIGKTYTAKRYDEGEKLPHIGYEVEVESAPAYVFHDDVGDIVDVLADMSGKYVEEV